MALATSRCDPHDRAWDFGSYSRASQKAHWHSRSSRYRVRADLAALREDTTDASVYRRCRRACVHVRVQPIER